MRTKEEVVVYFWFEYISECAEGGDVSVKEILKFFTGSSKIPATGFDGTPSNPVRLLLVRFEAKNSSLFSSLLTELNAPDMDSHISQMLLPGIWITHIKLTFKSLLSYWTTG